MGLDELRSEIIEDAERKSSKILEDANNQAEQILSKARQSVSDYESKLKEDESNLVLNLERMKVAQTRSEQKKQILDKKKALIDKAFENASKQLQKLSDAKKKQYLKKLLEKASKEIDVARIFCNKKDKGYFKGIPVEESDIIGGFIAEDNEGIIRVDYSFDTLLESIKENSLQDIAKILFKDE